ncbi:Gfo/Idh/MocA family protein [Coraliomargarita sinensis]|nr:Gfo/Idh/MocA family oxidoreductase [Coraliomargarita sinensis]
MNHYKITDPSRRSFMTKAAAGALASQFVTHPLFGQNASSNQLKIAGIGVGGMGRPNVRNCSRTENIAALCDVDTQYSQKTLDEHPNAKFYTDYREMFEAEEDLDGVVIATPDHTHAIIAMEAMRRGLHIYCQKPLTHTVKEARLVTEFARKSGVMTQMGNQGRSSESMRLLKEWLDAGVIGNVTEIRAWTDRPVGGQSYSTFTVGPRPEGTPPVPDYLDWDLWLGPAEERPYHPAYHPMQWRSYYDFGTGALGDMGCHILDPSFYALELGSPTVLEGSTTHWKDKVKNETFPRASILRMEFPSRGSRPPVTLNWTDGRLLPGRPKEIPNDVELPASGAMLIGDEGVILHGSHGAHNIRIFPEARRQAFLKNRPPKTIPRVKGTHESDWIRAIKTGQPACSDFNYGGALTEMVLLGVLALRVPNQRLEWDSKALQFKDHEVANSLVHKKYRSGWEL